ncbi:MAG: FAD-dependent oxidoreductase [Deltaproteobacteria bacterium]|nr:FAD-dependent oxidoreductase [Deltaproteobacteria bacterium]
MKIAVIGTGISGLVAARGISAEHDVEVFEADDRIGGHTHTHRVPSAAGEISVDTGFIVFNRRTYPHFDAMLDGLGVASRAADMSFSLSCRRTGLEWSGRSVNTLFAQRRNLFRPWFLRMMADALRFQRESPRLLEEADGELPLRTWLVQNDYSPQFIASFLVPLGAAIWSATPAAMSEMPARFFVRFFQNHGFLQLFDRPVWRTVLGGSERYVERLVEPFRDRIHLRTGVRRIARLATGVVVVPHEGPPRHFDEVVIATHSDQALRLLADPSEAERSVLGAIPYQENEAVLHTDESILPRLPRAWASWNYHVPGDPKRPVAVTYWMNHLQGLNAPEQFCVTLNPSFAIRPERVLRRITYHHPVFTLEGAAAQARWSEISGRNRTHYCGAYWRYGFHEDGMWSGLRVVEALAARRERDAERDARVLAAAG